MPDEDVLTQLISSPDRAEQSAARAYLVTARPARNGAELSLRAMEFEELAALELPTIFEGDDCTLEGAGWRQMGIETVADAMRFRTAQCGAVHRKWHPAIRLASTMDADTDLPKLVARMKETRHGNQTH
jgi:hypothetical protein